MFMITSTQDIYLSFHRIYIYDYNYYKNNDNNKQS